jgi:formylglycine-generating enzyme required for sulfatase activity
LYEASRPSATAWSAGVGNEERATSRPGVLPWVEVSWRSAKQACERAGKRLCTGEEWQKATGGPEGWLYLDSHEFDADRCNTYHPQTGPRDNAPTGSFPRCISPFGAYDLCGNVSEWTDETWQDGWPDHVIRGGSYNLNRRDDQGLYPFFGWRFTGYSETVTAVHHHTTNMNFSDDGFRCCADPQH